MDEVEAQQKSTVADLKSELVSLRKEIETIKNKKCAVENELIGKFGGQQKGLDESKELQQILIRYGNNPYGMSTLHYAIKKGDANSVTQLLENGADANSMHADANSWNVNCPPADANCMNLHFATQTNYTALSRAASCNQLEIAKILIYWGADVNYTVTKADFYPIYYAAKFGSGDLVTLLIESGSLFDTISSKKIISPETPLHTAAQAGNYEAVIVLVKAGLNVNAASHQSTPLDLAAKTLKYQDNPENLEIVKFLVNNGASRLDKKYYSQESGHNQLCPVISGYLQSLGL